MTTRAAAVPSAAARQVPELAAYRAMWSSAPPELARSQGIAVAGIAGGVCVATAAMPGGWPNHALGLGVTEPAGDDVLDEVDAFYRELGTPYQVSAAPSATGDLGERLLARGFRPGLTWMTFHRPAGPVEGPATTLRIEEATPATAGAFGAIVATAFAMPAALVPWLAGVVGLPGWTCLLALDGDRPVGAACLFVHGDFGWFGLGATLPEARGRGAQGSLFAERARRAVAQGARHLITETGAPAPGGRPGPSYRNMLRSGFAEVEARPTYLSPGS